LLFHNHPSGDPEPSPEDLSLTRRLIAGGSLLGIEVPDHIIVGDGSWRWISLKGLERGTPCPSKRFSTSGETTSRSCGDDSRSEARWAKARRGEVFTAVPSGYDLDATGQVTRTSDETVADAVTRVFEKFDELGTSGRGDEARKGAPREVRALLQGLVRCGQCGRRMMVSYGGGAGPAHAARC